MRWDNFFHIYLKNTFILWVPNGKIHWLQSEVRLSLHIYPTMVFFKTKSFVRRKNATQIEYRCIQYCYFSTKQLWSWNVIHVHVFIFISVFNTWNQLCVENQNFSLDKNRCWSGKLFTVHLFLLNTYLRWVILQEEQG